MEEQHVARPRLLHRARDGVLRRANCFRSHMEVCAGAPSPRMHCSRASGQPTETIRQGCPHVRAGSLDILQAACCRQRGQLSAARLPRRTFMLAPVGRGSRSSVITTMSCLIKGHQLRTAPWQQLEGTRPGPALAATSLSWLTQCNSSLHPPYKSCTGDE